MRMDTMSLALEIAKQNDLKWNSVKIIGAKVLSLLPFDILDDKELLSLYFCNENSLYFLS